MSPVGELGILEQEQLVLFTAAFRDQVNIKSLIVSSVRIRTHKRPREIVTEMHFDYKATTKTTLVNQYIFETVGNYD